MDADNLTANGAAEVTAVVEEALALEQHEPPSAEQAEFGDGLPVDAIQTLLDQPVEQA